MISSGLLSTSGRRSEALQIRANRHNANDVSQHRKVRRQAQVLGPGNVHLRLDEQRGNRLFEALAAQHRNSQ